MDYLNHFLFFTSIVVFGIILEILLARFYNKLTHSKLKKNHTSLGRYIFLLIAPMLAFLYTTTKLGYSPILVFAVFAVIGTLLEYLVGYAYHRVVGVRLWTYYRWSFGGYTSLLSTPLWGMLGLLTWLLAKIF